jgi:two-component system, NtrC family, sensor kinase
VIILSRYDADFSFADGFYIGIFLRTVAYFYGDFNMHQATTILIIESDPELLDLISKTLGQRYRVVKAKNQDEVLDTFSANTIDLILSDQPLTRIKHSFILNYGKDQVVVGISFGPPVLLTSYTEIHSFIRLIQEKNSEKDMPSILAGKEIASIVMDVLFAHLTQQVEKNEKNKAVLEKTGRMAALGELLPGIVHEISNPLSFISSNLDNLRKFIPKILVFIDALCALPVNDMVKAIILEQKKAINYDYLKNRLLEIVECSQSGAERAKTILDDVRRVAKSSMSEEFIKVNINRAIEATLNIMHNEFKNRITIEKILGSLPEVECHIGQINQVLMNILINACHAIEKEGRIAIVTRILPGGQVSIEISDSGKGIAEEDMKRIFEPFFTTKPENIGTGLGLPISRDIIKKHHGEIEIVSQPGMGTHVTVILPITH